MSEIDDEINLMGIPDRVLEYFRATDITLEHEFYTAASVAQLFTEVVEAANLAVMKLEVLNREHYQVLSESEKLAVQKANEQARSILTGLSSITSGRCRDFDSWLGYREQEMEETDE